MDQKYLSIFFFKIGEFLGGGEQRLLGVALKMFHAKCAPPYTKALVLPLMGTFQTYFKPFVYGYLKIQSRPSFQISVRSLRRTGQ